MSLGHNCCYNSYSYWPLIMLIINQWTINNANGVLETKVCYASVVSLLILLSALICSTLLYSALLWSTLPYSALLCNALPHTICHEVCIHLQRAFQPVCIVIFSSNFNCFFCLLLLLRDEVLWICCSNCLIMLSDWKQSLWPCGDW